MDPGEAAAIAAVAHRLRRRFPHLTAADIDRAVEQAEREYDGRPIRSFIPILVERDVVETLSHGSPSPVPAQRRGTEPATTSPPSESAPSVRA